MKYGLIKKNQSGVASVEVTLVMPFIFLIMIGGIELARTVYQYNTLVKNLRDATKYVSSAVRPINYNAESTTDPEVTRYKAVTAEASNLAMCGTIDECDSPSSSGLKSENIKLRYPQSIEVDGVTFTFVQMSVEDFSLGFITNLFGDSLALNNITYTMYQLQQN